MYLVEGARERLLQLERKRFIEEEWPVIKTKLARLEWSLKDLTEKEA